MAFKNTMTFEEAIIVQHCSVFDRLEKKVRAYEIRPGGKYAQYPVHVCVYFIEPRKRSVCLYTITPDNIRYLTIEKDGTTIYDSRTDVPCDMLEWEKTNSRFEVEGRPM